MAPAEEVAASVDLEEGWLQKLLTLPTQELAELLGDIANRGKIKTADIKSARTGLPSFRVSDSQVQTGVISRKNLAFPIHWTMTNSTKLLRPSIVSRHPFMRLCSRLRGIRRMSIKSGRCRGGKRQGSESWIRCVGKCVCYAFSILRICPVPCSRHRTFSRSLN